MIALTLWSCGIGYSPPKRPSPKEDTSYLKLGILQAHCFNFYNKKAHLYLYGWAFDFNRTPALVALRPCKAVACKRLWPISLLKTSLFAQRRLTTFCSNARFCLELGSKAEFLLMMCFYLVIGETFLNNFPIETFKKCFDIVFAINPIVNEISVFIDV